MLGRCVQYDKLISASLAVGCGSCVGCADAVVGVCGVGRVNEVLVRVVRRRMGKRLFDDMYLVKLLRR